jgi:carbamoyltransferase
LRAFQARTGCPVLVNTSFNVRGEPLVCSPQEAYQCFAATEMDALVLGDAIVEKSPDMKIDSKTREKYLAQFQLD